ncbi:glutamine synthetase III family protein [Stomatobaculum longum]|uniref:glutamine synthetase III family protein n=1 Tax=Stomatobaculum longum TaxID=796942 RepID=UPI0028DB4DF0|nr:glutamine synthetase III [Stomatobaculum longum]
MKEKRETINIAELFGENVFSDRVMRERLPNAVYRRVKKSMTEGYELERDTADAVAQAMKAWAVENGATHYTHWFQPLSGVAAEKHDSFLSGVDSEGRALLEFSGKNLVRSETDASSFPSGGLRATFEARGYTVWDCTSPAFLRKEGDCVTLCIPTAFCAYAGEALDQKTPLLRSMEALNREAMRILKLFGVNDARWVKPSVGAEQEYFIIDREKYLKRKDLIYTGRTLFGSMPAKGQELDDHYFGVLRRRIAAFMRDVDLELWKLGVSAKTEHNEVAPGQHELAPIFEEANLAVDHNQLTMEILQKQAGRHGLECLLHEKPFAGVNGSGKHNNWSVATDTGLNLLNPGKRPHENQLFLLTLACVLAAVDTHADLLRLSAANVGNDHRLGADEAPPAIISCFLGTQLEDIVAQIIETGSASSSISGKSLETHVNTLPNLYADVTDRNRTSPFAFTGNKFEFRMVGSGDSIASANIVLNTILAEQFRLAADRLETAASVKDAAQDLIRELLTAHQRIVFNGNGYSEEWVQEAARRGLPNLKSSIDAIPAFTSKKAVELFSAFGIYSETELKSRSIVAYENYAKRINIEARAMINISGKQLIPAAIHYVTRLASSVNQVKSACPAADVSTQEDLLLRACELLSDMKRSREKLLSDTDLAASIQDPAARAAAYHTQIVADMRVLRESADALETVVDKDLWPLPSYGDLLFEVSEP